MQKENSKNTGDESRVKIVKGHFDVAVTSLAGLIATNRVDGASEDDIREIIEMVVFQANAQSIDLEAWMKIEKDYTNA